MSTRLLFLLTTLFVSALAFAQSEPQAPCGRDAVPAYPRPDDPPTVKLWSRAALGANWKPPACTGWSAPGFTSLVTTAARFHHASGADDLLRHIGAISELAGMRYWSTTHQKWQVLIPDAYALTDPKAGKRRDAFAPGEMKEGKTLYFAQVDNLTGKGIFQMHIAEASADRIVFSVENVSTMRYLFLTIFQPGEMQSIYFLDRESDDVWRYYSIMRTGLNASNLVTANGASAINRAVAFYRSLAGIPTDKEPPAAR